VLLAEMILLLNSLRAGPGGTDRVIEQLGLERVAELALEEVLFRADLTELPHGNGDTFLIRIDFEHPGHEPVSALLRISPKEVARVTEETPRPVLSVTQDLTEVLVALYGCPGETVAGSRNVRWPGLWRDMSAFQPGVFPERRVLSAAERILSALDGGERENLSRIAVRHRSDKWGAHRYAPHYERHLSRFRDRQITFVEIGVGGYHDPDLGGESLRMWKRFFPRALIHGVDITDKSPHHEPRITTWVADQSDPDSLTALAEKLGPFDVIVDDGSHVNDHVVTSFEALFPHLRDGGVYVVEDLQTAYWPAFGGSPDADDNTSISFLKGLVDGLNHEEFPFGARPGARATDALISGVHFYHNLAFVERGGNREGSPLARALEGAGLPAGAPNRKRFGKS